MTVPILRPPASNFRLTRGLRRRLSPAPYADQQMRTGPRPDRHGHDPRRITTQFFQFDSVTIVVREIRRQLPAQGPRIKVRVSGLRTLIQPQVRPPKTLI